MLERSFKVTIKNHVITKFTLYYYTYVYISCYYSIIPDLQFKGEHIGVLAYRLHHGNRNLFLQ